MNKSLVVVPLVVYLERGVAYGAMFPDSIDTMHQANEFIALDDLFRAAAIYAEAIYELIK